MNATEFVATIVIRTINQHATEWHGRKVVFVDSDYHIEKILSGMADVCKRVGTTSDWNGRTAPEIQAVVQREFQVL